MHLYWMKKVEVFNKCVQTMEKISQQRAKNWVVVFESEPSKVSIPTNKWLNLLRVVCTHDSISNIWKVHLSFNQRQRRSLLEKEWSREHIHKGVDVETIESKNISWTWPTVSQDIDIPCLPNSSKHTITVTRTHVPMLELSQTEEVLSNWFAYAIWIMDKLDVDAFNFKEHVGMIRIETDTLGIFRFECSSTWLLDGETQSIYYNYKLEQCCIHNEVLKRVTPHEIIDSKSLLPLHCNTAGTCVLIQAECSMGKTSIGMDSVIKHHIELKHSILLVTENRALSFHFLVKFPQFTHYSSLTKGSVQPVNPSYLICQIESIQKMKRVYDVIVLDEITSCFTHVLSPTMNKEHILGPSLNLLLVHIKKSPFLYGFDADIPPHVFDFVSDVRTSDPPCLIKYTHRPLLHRELFLVKTTNELLFSLEESLKNGENCVLVLQSITLSKRIMQKFFTKSTSVLLINSEGASLFVDGENVYEKDDVMKELVLKNVEEHFSQVQLLIYTPSIKTGVSFESNHFNRVYGIACNKTASAREFQQSLLRVRNVSTGEYFVCLGDTHIGSMKKLEEMKIRQHELATVLYGSQVQLQGFKPGILPLLSQPCGDSMKFNAVQYMMDMARFEKECSEWHFGILFISYMCQERGFLFDYFHHVQGFNTSCFKQQNIRSESTHLHEREKIAREISETEDIDVERFLYLHQKRCEHALTNEQKNEMSKFMLRKQLGVGKDFVFTPTFLLQYMDHGEYIQFLRTLEPVSPCKETMTDHLRKRHEHMRRSLISKLKIIEQKEADEEERTLLETALRIYVNPRYKKAEVALEFLNMFGFEGHTDSRICDGYQLDLLWKMVVFSRAKDLLYRLKHLFSSLHMERCIQLSADSTRRKFLGFINSILHEGLGVRIQQIGKKNADWYRFGLFVSVPLVTSSGVLLRSKRTLHMCGVDHDVLQLKHCKL